MSSRYKGGFISLSYDPFLVPNAPTIGTASASDGSASVTFTAPSNVGGGAITSYVVLSSGGQTATGSSSPITVTGLTNGTAYTFVVFAVNAYGNSPASAASNSVTPIESTYLFTWGANNVGQLGLGNVTYYSSPKQIGALGNWLQTTAGGYSAVGLAIKTDGTLWSWGNGGRGSLGHGSVTSYSSPVQVGALATWSKVKTSGGGGFTLATKTDGTLWAWGQNAEGQLGQSNTTNRSSPVQVGALTNWLDFACGQYHSLAVKTDGTLWSWGYNYYGTLGLGNSGTYTSKSSPTQVGSLTNWSKVSSAYETSFAIKTDGTLWSWGRGSNGITGLGSTTNYSSPVQVGSLTNWYSISGGQYGVLAIKTDGTLWAWGSGIYGGLGLNNTTTYYSPKQVGSLTTWTMASSGSASGFAIKTDKTLWAWGQNEAGRLGLGNTTNYSSPKQIGSKTTWVYVSAGIRNNRNAFAISTST